MPEIGLKKSEFALSSLAIGADTIIAIAGVICAALLIAGTQYIYCFIISAKSGRMRWVKSVKLPNYCGYLSKTSNNLAAELYVHAKGPFYVSVRHATQNDAPEWRSPNFPCHAQSACFDVWGGLNWSDPVTIPLSNLRDGAHIVDIIPQDEAAQMYRIPMLVRHEWRSVIVVSSTNTWNAYNKFGGISNYYCGAIPLPLRPLFFILQSTGRCFRLSDRIVIPTVPLPKRRPLHNINDELRALQSDREIGASHLYRGELCLLRSLDKLGIPYSVASDEDVENFDINKSSTKIVFFNTHSEYWSDLGISALNNLISRGISVAFLSGNNIYRRVQRTESGLQVIDQMVNIDETARLIGAGYDALGYQTFAGYRVIEPDHWLFSNCSELQSNGYFGRGDGTSAHPGGSGHETDKIRPSSEGFQLLAMGENAEGGASMVCKDLPGGGFVFNASSVSFTAMLEADASLPQLIENMVERALGQPKSLEPQLSETSFEVAS